MKKRIFKTGMTLIELVVVIGILGILFTAVYMFFVKGTEQFHFTRRQNQLATTGRLALEMLSDEILWAGYMPYGGWTEDQWKPVEVATDGTFDFYADMDGNKALSNSDHRNIYLDTSENILHITDDGTMDRIAGTDITAIQFNFVDSDGDFLAKPLDEVDREAVRHIAIKLTLQSTYMGDVYQTVMQTMVSPRNLGVYHNFDPLFYMPPPPDAKIVVNIDGDSTAHAPTVHQDRLLTQLDVWGFTLVDLTDDELMAYDYDSSGVDIVILRNMSGAVSSSHNDIPGLGAALLAIPVPVIMLDPDDAVEVFLMGEGAGFSPSPGYGEMFKTELDHPIHASIDSLLFKMYEINTGTTITLIDSLYPVPGVGTELITASLPDSTSGVCVINQSVQANRRVHLCAPDFYDYSSDGWQLLYNILMWSLPEGSVPPLGEEINTEGFEGEAPGEIPVVFWEDDLEDGVNLPDSTALYTSFGTGAKDMIWVYSSTGSGEINLLTDLSLEMHRTATGSFDRNIAGSLVDLSPFNASQDELYITVEGWKGSSEMINAEDGVFLMSTGGSIDTLVSEDFETLAMGNGDVEFWGDLYGRHRIHSPEPAWNNTTTFVTLDTRINGNYGRSRMMMEVDASGLEDGTSIVVNYRMTDHGDESSAFSSLTNRGDYIGWSLGKEIEDSMEGYENLEPGSKSNGVWADYSYTFTPSGTMPSTLYIIFSQYDNYTATSATGSDGISFDDITVIADNTVLDMSRIGTPSSSASWQKIAVDLDDAAISNGVPFSAAFGIALSQYGMGPWSAYGMHWRYFELGVITEKYTVPGWHHEPMNAGGIDDWTLQEFSGNHKWTLHENGASYSDDSYCWLETPQITIPFATVDPILSFVHSVDFENARDFGWIEVSTNGGTSWEFIEADSYNGDHGGHRAFTSTIGTSTVELNLDSYVGQKVQFRFVFESDGSITRSGWTLDNFEASGTVSGVLIESIGFKPTSPMGTWYFNEVDIYLGNTTETVFTGDGEWDKGLMTYFGTFEVYPSSIDEWVIINLGENYILPADANLIVKMEMSQTGPSTGYTWVGGTHPNTARWETSLSGDPSYLKVVGQRPAFMIGTGSHGLRYVDADSTAELANMPLAFSAFFGDFEAIYTLEELGFGGNVPWVPGGLNNDWEIGVPLFTPDVDPALIPRNENRIAGTDLTDNGYYSPNAEWNWLRSGAYEMSETAAYDSVALAYDRCLRRALNDLAFIQMAFTTTADAPTENSDWTIVQRCDYDDDIWHSEVVQLTSYFEEARAQGKEYYFIRFVMSAGPFAEKGGWNIDNVGFYGRFAN